MALTLVLLVLVVVVGGAVGVVGVSGVVGVGVVVVVGVVVETRNLVQVCVRCLHLLGSEAGTRSVDQQLQEHTLDVHLRHTSTS